MNTENSKRGSNVSSVVDVFQANWIPLSLIGVGITWLVVSKPGLTERIAKDKRVQTADSRIGEIASDLGSGGSTKDETRQTGQILGPDGRPLHSGDVGRDKGWVTQATGAARSAIISSIARASTPIAPMVRARWRTAPVSWLKSSGAILG
jgi:hypothetical protein